MTPRVIGIGQPARGDDGVGLVVLERLRDAALPPGTDLRCVAEPSRILPLLAGADPVVLVDAVLGGEPGRVLRLDAEDLAGAGVLPLSTHGLGVAQALALARTLEPDAMPRRLVLVGVCIAAAEPGERALSAAVAAAVPEAVAEVERVLGAPGGGMHRKGIDVRGTVQGVGFRPFVWRAARARGLGGWVRNGAGGVRIEVEGEAAALRSFLDELAARPPAEAVVESVMVEDLAALGETGFRIEASRSDEAARPVVPADLAACAACLAEVRDPAARRHGYPFTNCTQCGPRYTIVAELPYDRPRTSMRGFAMCPDCANEYGDPADRRFHAQPIACPRCGPQLALLAPDGSERARGTGALDAAIAALRAGAIVALRGLGGFQLLVDATDPGAVARLRSRKRRPDKPLAVMFPDERTLRACCTTSPEEERILRAPESPILLVPRRDPVPAGAPRIAVEVAPGNPTLGVMLPYTPLHALLLEAVARPLVCTSGNLSEEPMCIDTEEALERLGRVADAFLTHDRPVLRPVDDSVGRVGSEGLEVLRRARGFVARPLGVAAAGSTVLAVGGHLKCTVALLLDDAVVLSQHLGDLDAAPGRALLARTVDDLVRLFAARPAAVTCDLHPDYASTRLAERLASRWEVPLERVQHHHAHVASCAAENRLSGPVLGLAWDGSGWGPDGTVWGGEALVADGAAWRRVAHLRTFALPGGERAVGEPRRSALGALYEILGDGAEPILRDLFSAAEMQTLSRALRRGVQAPRTSSAGRLFDAVAALAGLRDRASFEGQAAMELEFAAAAADPAPPYPLPLRDGEPAVADWEPLLQAVLADRERRAPVPAIAARFHAALAELGVAIARRTGLPRVVLSGGCFQNRLLQEALRRRLREAGFEVYTHHQVPANDGGLALGQAVVAAARLAPAPGGERHVPRHPRQGALHR